MDMTKQLNDASLLGSDWKADYTTMSITELAADQKALKNKGYYRGAAGGYRYNQGSTTTTVFATWPITLRRVLCTVHLDPNVDHYIRIRCTSTSKLGNNNEFMIDYLEIVPKSVYAVDGEGEMEDDL